MRRGMNRPASISSHGRDRRSRRAGSRPASWRRSVSVGHGRLLHLRRSPRARLRRLPLPRPSPSRWASRCRRSRRPSAGTSAGRRARTAARAARSPSLHWNVASPISVRTRIVAPAATPSSFMSSGCIVSVFTIAWYSSPSLPTLICYALLVRADRDQEESHARHQAASRVRESPS